MMGKLFPSPDEPVTKTTKGLIVLPLDHPWVVSKGRSLSSMMRLAKAACCHCSLCTDLCPRHLLGHRLRPDRLMRLASYDQSCDAKEAATEAFLCCECGLCELACVMGLQPWRLNSELKRRLGAKGVKNPCKEAPQETNPFRQWRQFPIEKLIRMTGLSQWGHEPAPLKPYPLPVKKVRLLMKQHLGAPAEPRVGPGQEVVLGQLVASPPEGALGAPIHASLSGHVLECGPGGIVIEAP
jgi:Na+-translocating ferredoxin:NAD+ oxidoreductase RnfC subunit